LFPGFSLDFLQSIATPLKPVSRGSEVSIFSLKHLLNALHFSVLYESWLHDLSGVSRAIEARGDGRKMANLPALLVWAKSLRYGTNPGPSSELLVALLDELLERNAGGAPDVV